MQTLTVNTPSHSYPIFIGRRLFDRYAAETLRPYIKQKAAIVTNQTVAPIYLAGLQKSLDDLGVEHFAIVLPDGEEYKNWETLNLIFDGMLEHKAERRTTLIALGGGVVGDMVGFAAAVYQRGAPFIQVPTTLLSQVDSSVGGKTAVNHPLGKNMIGAFYQPQAVLADLSLLSTLPPREFSAGMAEVIKYALLGDAGFLAWLEDHIEDVMQQKEEALGYLVYHCCKMKAEIVAADEKEQGIRAWLNLGHTFGHAIEAEMGYGVWLHGEAVAAGMVLACRLSQELGCLTERDTQRVCALLLKAGLPIRAPVFAFERWIEHMRHDKKVNDGTMRFVSLKRLGEACVTPISDMDVLRRVLEAC